VVVVSDLDWKHDKQLFVSRLRQRSSAHSGGTKTRPVADDRSSIWSPLARQFADMGRELFAAGSPADVLQRVITVAMAVVPGIGLASITMRRGGGKLHTPAYSDRLAIVLDKLQNLSREGPFAQATRRDGTGMASSSDLARERCWPRFGPRAAEQGMRSVVSVGVFPAAAPRRVGALNFYTTEPRGLAAVDPDAVLVLASYAATALSVTDAVTETELANAEATAPMRSNFAMERAAYVLTEKRYLPPEDVYDVLRGASERLIEAWRG
jgi:hypothetical protein